MPVSDPSPLRILVVAAHPDDEIIGAAALLRRLTLASARIDMIHVTDGAPRNGTDARAHGFSSVEAYRRARRVELERAVDEAGISCARMVALGVPDQEAAHALVGITRMLVEHLHAGAADVILTHAFEGGHPDHDATAFATHAATRLIAGSAPTPIVEFASYHLGSNGIETGTFLSSPAQPCAVLRLTAGEQRTKRRARGCFVSQAATLDAFGLEQESFRRAPRYDFARRPHAGRLLYEYFDWGLRGDEWERLASSALNALQHW